FLSYRDNPIGEAIVTNVGDAPLRGCVVGFRFEDGKQEKHSRLLLEPWSTPLPELAPGASTHVLILPKLSTEILSSQTREVTPPVFAGRRGERPEGGWGGVFVHGRDVLNGEKPEGVVVFIDPGAPAVRELVQIALE